MNYLMLVDQEKSTQVSKVPVLRQMQFLGTPPKIYVLSSVLSVQLDHQAGH